MSWAPGGIDAGDDLQAATDKVAAAAGRAARRVDDQTRVLPRVEMAGPPPARASKPPK